jgi:hypothetical protein
MDIVEKLELPFDAGEAPSLEESDEDKDDGKCICIVHKPSTVSIQNIPQRPDLPAAKAYAFPVSLFKEDTLCSIDGESPEDVLDFLQFELDLSRLDKIHSCLWLAGRPQPARPLHRHLMMGREIVITEQFDLHLAWRGSQIFLKPLPPYLLDPEFWETYLIQKDIDTKRKKQAAILHGNACGFILSYTWLIRHPSDMRIARSNGLIPKIKWQQWRKFVKEFLARVDPVALDKVNRRFHHGELRSARLNMIYRFYPPVFNLTHLFRGYTIGYDRYGTFFQQNFGWLITVFAFLSVILSAMQTGLGTNRLNDDIRFQRASAGFVAFSIILLVAVIGLGLIFLLVLVINNLVATIKIQRKAWDKRHRVVP